MRSRTSATSGLRTTRERIDLSTSILLRMRSKIAFSVWLPLALFLALTGHCRAQSQDAIHFDQFHVKVFDGHIKMPHEFHKSPDGLWLDDAGKPASKPRVNFAGEYFLAAHSCGTCCRYYTLDSLRTGNEIDSISIFATGDSPPRTKDGHTYVPVLFFKPASRLLIVQYQLDLCTPREEGQCRQQYFAFEDGRFKAISNTFPQCTHEDEEPE